MEDGGKPPHSFGSGGGQRNQHSRPFFYVQPPSQPYYMYQQLHLNNPFNPYGLPGGYNFGRPCIHPYSYMQYPGFPFPQAPMHPVDYRRMFEPRFHSAPWSDMGRPQPPPQAHARREMACSEAQTDPSDAISKLIECLGKIRANELAAERELDSGVASQTSGIFSPGDEKKSEDQGAAHASLCPALERSRLRSPAAMFIDSTTAVYDCESSQRSLEDLSPPGAWSVGLEELPLDSSSVHELSPEGQQAAGDEDQLFHPLPAESLCQGALQTEDPTDVAGETVTTALNFTLRCDVENLLKQSIDADLPPAPCISSTQQVAANVKSGDRLSMTARQPDSPGGVDDDVSYRILKLPFESTPAAAAPPKDSHLLCGDSSARLQASGCLSSPVSSFYYGYLPTQKSHERMSVLSPSLDELSSREEMFSTDLEDMDLFPKHVYASRRLAEVVGASPKAPFSEGRPGGPKRYACACCGEKLAKGASRSKVHGSKTYREEAGDSDDDCQYGRGCERPARVVLRKHSAARKPDALPLRHVSKHLHKRGQCKDVAGPAHRGEAHDHSMNDTADGETGEITSSDVQCRTCQDRLCREDAAIDQWEDNVHPRGRQPIQLHRHEMNSLRKVPCSSLPYHRARDEENKEVEPPPRHHWDRGSGKSEPRC